MLKVLSSEAIQLGQEVDEKLQSLISSEGSSSKLQRLFIEHPVYFDTSTHWVRLYIQMSPRRRAFDVVNSFAHPSTLVTVRQLKEKFIWAGIKRYHGGVDNAFPARDARFSDTIASSQQTSTFLEIASSTCTST